MSDRPMRLKYLKIKMKIILCIFLLCITAVSVFGEPQELNGILGESVKFPAAVKKDGNLMYGSQVIGRILSGTHLPLTTPEFRDRVQWVSSTGHFSLSGLRLNDSGVYKVEKNDGQKSAFFNLTVWKDNVNVSKPHVNVTRNEYPCTLLCTVVRGTRVTLTLYKNGETNPYVTSPGHSHPDLNMTVPVESGTYTCEAKNSVSRETSEPLTVGAHCTVNVSKPHVNVTRNEYPCTLLCTVVRGTEVTLSWYREGEDEPFISLVESAPGLHLPQTVERSGNYTCEAKNSVSNETSDPLTVGAHCTAGPSTGTIVASVIAVVAILIAVVFAVLYRCKTKPASPADGKTKPASPADDEDEQALSHVVLENCKEPPLPAYDEDEQALSHVVLENCKEPPLPAYGDEGWTVSSDGNINTPPPPSYAKAMLVFPPDDTGRKYDGCDRSDRNDVLETEKGDPPPN